LSISISIHFDRGSSKPLYIQLYEGIKAIIEENSFNSSEKLPSIKKLSKTLRINTITVINAFKLLENEGFIEMRQGSGTYLRPNRLKVINNSPNNILDELYSSEEMELMKSGEISLDSDLINFASTTPSPDFFPMEDFKRVIIETIEKDGMEAFNYQESLGYKPLREILCTQLNKKNVKLNPTNVQIISGAQQGIDIVAKALIKKGDCVIVESPTYLGATAVFKACGAQIESIVMENDGINTEKLLDLMKKYRPKLIYTIPTNQNPTGYTYSVEKRKKLLEIASAFKCYIIEDDFLSELNYSENQPPLLKSFDNEGRVILIKSYSKLLMPGLRIGFMIVPDNIMPQINDAKHITDISTSGLIQRAFARFMEYEMWEKHLECIIPVYKGRFDYMKNRFDELKKYDVNFNIPEGGLNLWVKMPEGINIGKLYTSACRNGIAFIPGSIFYMNSMDTNAGNQFIRFSFSQTNEKEIEKGMDIFEYCLEREFKGKLYRNTFPRI